MKVHLRMTGCRLNQSEIDTMARHFEAQGHQITTSSEDADQIIVNTCAVTQEATRSSRALIRDLHRSNQQAAISVTGCYAQISPDEIAVIDGVKRVVGNAGKDSLVSQITGQPLALFDLEPHAREKRPGFDARTRAFVKVQDGCDNACTFCVTTIARGAGRSRPADEILNEIHYLHDSGYQEIVLTGVHLGSYGHDLGDQQGLLHLVQQILTQTAVARLRLSSLEPWDLAPGFFDLWQDARLQPHLHLPLQSGCDATLRRMRRNTSQAAFRSLMAEARARIADVRITTDVIVGFPGENEQEWQESLDFIREMAFDGMHVFRYSVRPGTPAARLRGKVSEEIKKQRSQLLIALSAEQEQHFAQRFVGRRFDVLWEQIAGATEAGFMNAGYTHNYIRVQSIHPRILSNQITPAVLDQIVNGVAEVSPVLE